MRCLVRLKSSWSRVETDPLSVQVFSVLLFLCCSICLFRLLKSVDLNWCFDTYLLTSLFCFPKLSREHVAA